MFSFHSFLFHLDNTYVQPWSCMYDSNDYTYAGRVNVTYTNENNQLVLAEACSTKNCIATSSRYTYYYLFILQDYYLFIYPCYHIHTLFTKPDLLLFPFSFFFYPLFFSFFFFFKYPRRLVNHLQSWSQHQQLLL